MCKCVFCQAGKDVWTLVRRVCGSTLNVIDDTNKRLCVPLLMVVAAHKHDPAAFLKQHYPHLLDWCYDQPPRTTIWLLRNDFFRDQATFHHALFHKADEHAQLLLKSGCPFMVYLIKSWWSYNGGGGIVDVTHFPLRSKPLESWMIEINKRGAPYSAIVSATTCVAVDEKKVPKTTSIAGVHFVAYRIAKNKPTDMREIYRAELEWAVKYEKMQNERAQERQLALKIACSRK
jgi:hypothetical protein